MAFRPLWPILSLFGALACQALSGVGDLEVVGTGGGTSTSGGGSGGTTAGGAAGAGAGATGGTGATGATGGSGATGGTGASGGSGATGGSGGSGAASTAGTGGTSSTGGAAGCKFLDCSQQASCCDTVEPEGRNELLLLLQSAGHCAAGAKCKAECTVFCDGPGNTDEMIVCFACIKSMGNTLTCPNDVCNNYAACLGDCGPL